MNTDNAGILQPDELIKTLENNGAAIIGALNDQWVTLQLLGGTLPMVMGVYSQFFSSMLSQLALQSGLASAQLGEQQLYDAASLESAAATYLLLDILSGNVEGVVEKLTALAEYGQGLLTKAGELPALLEKLGGSEKSDITKSGDILTGGLNALGSIESATKTLNRAQGVGGFLKGGIGFLLPLLSGPALPVIIGAITVAMGGFFALKALKSGIQKEQEKKEAETAAKTNIPAPGAAPGAAPRAAAAPAAPPDNNTPDNIPADSDEKAAPSPRVIDPVDPFQTGSGADSDYSQYRQQTDGSRQNTTELRDAVEKGNSEVAVRLAEVAEVLRQLATKPADRSINSEVVIQSLHTNQTLSEFRDMLTELLKYDEQLSV